MKEAKFEQKNPPHVQMTVIFEVTLPTNLDAETAYYDVGGFEVRVNGLAIPFDFEASGLTILSTHIKDGNCHIRFSYAAGRGLFFNEYSLDPCHEEAWLANGLTIHDLTAKHLSSASEITEFYFGAGDNKYYRDGINANSIVIESITFSDKENDYSVDQEVCNRYKQPV